MKTKKIPMRMCLGCRQMKPKRELVRVIRTPEGEMKLDVTGKASGRGAYLCRSRACLQQSIKTRALSRAFEAAVGDDVLAQLEKEIDG